MTPHDTHDSKVHPVEGCRLCDAEVRRPIPVCYGGGSSTSVMAPPPPPKEGDK